MAGEITSVQVTALTRNAATVRVEHTATGTWGGGNGTFDVQYSTTGPGGPFQAPPSGDVGTPSDHCNLTDPANSVAPVGTVTEFSIFDPAIAHDSDVWVRVTAVPNTGTGDVVIEPVRTLDYPTYACFPGPVTETTAALRVNLNSGYANVDPCDNDSFSVEWGTTPGGPYPNTSPVSAVTNGIPTHTATGLTPATTYYYRTTFTEQVETGGVIFQSPECQITTATPAPTNPNNATRATGYVKDTQFRADWTVDNVAPADVIVVAFGTTPGGPYTQVGATTPGDNTVGQASTLIASNGVFSVLPGTTYYYRTEVRQGGGAGPVISASPECSLTTDAAGTSDWFGVDVAPSGRNGTFVGIGPIDDWHINPANSGNAASPQDWVGIEHSVNGAPFVAVPAQHLFGGGGGGGPLGFNPYRRDGSLAANQGVNVSYPYAATDEIAYRVTYYVESGGGAPGDVRQVVTTPAVTLPEYPTVECNAVDITQTTATIRFARTNTGEFNYLTFGGDDPYDNRDILRVVYGTTPGGPYPSQSSGPRVTSPTVNDQPLTGLLPGTTYYYRMQADEFSEQNGSPNQRNSGTTARRNEFMDTGECSFTTLAAPVVDPPIPGGRDRLPFDLDGCCDDDETGGGEPAGASTSTDDECLTDDNGVFFRRTSNDGEGGVTVSTVDVAGAAYTPVGEILPCSPAEQAAVAQNAQVEEESVCAIVNGVTQPLFRRVTIDSAGVETITFHDATGPVPAANVTSYQAGDCPDPERLIVCDSTGAPFIQFHGLPSAANPTGISYFTLDGAPGNPVAPMQLCDAQDVNDPTEYQTTVVDVTGATPTTFTPNGDLVAWTVRNRDATTATLQVNGGAVLPLDTAETIGASLSGHDVNDVLDDTLIVSPGDGAVRVSLTRRI